MEMIIDSHCHIDFKDFDDDREQVLERAKDIGIKHIILPGISLKNWPRQKNLCLQYKQIHPAYGLHPYFLNEHQHDHLIKLSHWLDHESAIAVGECGLDFYLKDLDKNKQIAFLDAQLKMAIQYDLPVILHARKATEQIIQMIKKHPGLRGMMHSYSGSLEQARQLIDLGFYISFGGVISYEKSTRIRSMAQNLPLESLLIETDAPDQPDFQNRGQRNEPCYIMNTLKVLSHLRETSIETIAEVTSKNALSLFRISADTN